MDWLADRHLFAIAVFLYGVSTLYSIFLYRKGFRSHNRATYILLLVAFAFHSAAMFKRGYDLNHCPVRNYFELTMFTAWTMVAAYLVIGLWSRLRFLGAFASPVLFAIGVFALMPQLDKPNTTLKFEVGAWLSVHVALFALAYGAFGLSAVSGLMYLMQERDLKLHKIRAFLSKLPPIQRLDLATGRLMLAGFALLTLALAVSIAGYTHFGGKTFTLDWKIIWSFFVWAAYGTLIFIRWKYTQNNRRLAWGTVAGFAFLLLTFWAASLTSPLHRPMP
jgi:ABC-type uncharacterized transport system permease subunit